MPLTLPAGLEYLEATVVPQNVIMFTQAAPLHSPASSHVPTYKPYFLPGSHALMGAPGPYYKEPLFSLVPSSSSS